MGYPRYLPGTKADEAMIAIVRHRLDSINWKLVPGIAKGIKEADVKPEEINEWLARHLVSVGLVEPVAYAAILKLHPDGAA